MRSRVHRYRLLSFDRVCQANIRPSFGGDIQIDAYGGSHRTRWQCVGMGSGSGQVQQAKLGS